MINLKAEKGRSTTTLRQIDEPYSRMASMTRRLSREINPSQISAYLTTNLPPNGPEGIQGVPRSFGQTEEKVPLGGRWSFDGVKCKINWSRTCFPTASGGLGILNLDKFARALRLRWLWHEWRSPEKAWVGSGTPCDDTDKLLFTAATSITVGDGARASFWELAWLQGRRLKNVAPLVYAASKKRPARFSGPPPQINGYMILTCRGNTSWTMELIDLLIEVWSAVQNLHLIEHEEDKITWKLTSHGECTATLAYKAQLLGTTATNFNNLIWKPWAPRKCKIFAGLIIQNRVWTSDKLATGGWPNGSMRPLCRHSQETAILLLAECRYTRRIWGALAEWTANEHPNPSLWH